MFETWLTTSPEEVLLVLLSAFAIFATAVVSIRIFGLRSLSKMSSFDFVITVALGSVVASITVTSASLLNGMIGFAGLLGIQWATAILRDRTSLGSYIDNEPLLLMDGTRILDDNLRSARVTHDDLVAKLREANVTRWDQVLAVVLETTGDISVLHGQEELEDGLLSGVRTEA